MQANKIVVMPCLRRIEMLALALEKLRETGEGLDVRVFPDAGANLEEVQYVRDQYYPDATILPVKAHISVPSGMWNILMSIKAGFETDALKIFLVEEDVLVYPDFFRWHDQAQRLGPFATCGRRMPRLPNYNQYTNPGSCFSHESLAGLMPHINDEMFADRRAYYQKHFGVMDEVSDLDDGLIRRYAKFHGFDVIYPLTPKCAHIGFGAYNHYQDWKNLGTIQERIDNLRKMLLTVDRNGRYTRDFEPHEDR